MQYQLIFEQPRLEAYLAELADGPLAIDTEFVRTRTYYPQLGLFQSYDGHQLALIDPLAVDMSPLWKILGEPGRLSVLHASGEDLELIQHEAGHLPALMHDTQLAAAFLGYGVSVGFGALVKDFLGVELVKDQARTDWLARPLSPRQLDYAAADVFYLVPLYRQVMARLAESGKLAWFEEECRSHCARKVAISDPYQAYLDIGNAWQLGRRELAILRELAAWRQQEAVRRDLAVNFVVKELHLYKVAERRPASLRDLNELGLLPIEIKIHGKRLLDIVAKAQAGDPQLWPERIRRLVDFPQYKGELKRIKALVEEKSKECGVPPELIASKKTIHQYFTWSWRLSEAERAALEPPALLTGWRRELVGHLLQE
ncbi:ribonuclease D [Aeromonas schubertii]|uniref:Ribonuclease D n=1 Tax=Aeromonas schubertii TaxID=652 RepID=A0A0S2SDV3_9GAMM|nr:ribonuclease D [Aeromonas schubertii]ALP39895.1 ribonuclease D [Aeromonas schubertii]